VGEIRWVILCCPPNSLGLGSVDYTESCSAGCYFESDDAVNVVVVHGYFVVLMPQHWHKPSRI
jgi:hypothetical protein